jgi:predicted RNA binding protein YcfA (HicA-like mRNA interferase family)
MSKKEKLLKKALETPQNLRFDEFEALLTQHKFVCVRKGGGSHFIYRHPKLGKPLPVQNENGMAKEYQIKQFFEQLQEIKNLED